MSCFICDGKQTQFLNIYDTITEKRKVPLYQIIYDFVGKHCEVTINNHDIICETCNFLLNQLEQYYFDTKNVENMLMKQMYRKYKIDCDDLLLYDLNENVLETFEYSEMKSTFPCLKCSFEALHTDELVPHARSHEMDLGKKCVLSSSPKIACSVCNLSFTKNELLKFHFLVFHFKRKLSCENTIENDDEFERKIKSNETEYLDDSYDSEPDGNLSTQEIVKPIENFACGFCDFKTNSAVDIQTHSFDHQSLEQPMTCKTCSKYFTKISDLIEHVTYHRSNYFQCSLCEKIEPTSKDLVLHYSKFHEFTSTEIENSQVCPLPPIKKHYKTDQFVCQICKVKCRSKKTLENHNLRRHLEHICNICNKKLGSLLSLESHKAVHGINAKFKCPHCDKGFRAKSQLNSHIVVHTKEYNFSCHICGQKFIHSRSHRIHVLWHENPRPHKCPLCDKTYKHRSHLAVHRRTHSGELPNACDYCEKKFTSASKLKVHMVEHTGIYSHPCELCNKGFMKRYKLAEHMSNIHGDSTMLLNKPKCQYKIAVNPEFEQKLILSTTDVHN